MLIERHDESIVRSIINRYLRSHKVRAGDNSEYIDFNSDGSFLASAHQNGLIRLWVWMGEDPDLNEKRHSWVKEQQTDAQGK